MVVHTSAVRTVTYNFLRQTWHEINHKDRDAVNTQNQYNYFVDRSKDDFSQFHFSETSECPLRIISFVCYCVETMQHIRYYGCNNLSLQDLSDRTGFSTNFVHMLSNETFIYPSESYDLHREIFTLRDRYDLC